jgi:hypothetical protein
LSIPASLVADVARASGIAPRAAVDRLVVDAIASQGAQALGIDRAGAAAWQTAAALASTVPDRLKLHAQSAGPPTNAELATLTVSQVVVLRSPGVPQDRARAAAAAVHREVADARSAEEFEAKAKAFPHPGTEVVVERLHGFGADGLGTDEAEYDPTFVAAAFALGAPGEVSSIVETPFGWHAIYLVERAPPDPASVEQRRLDLGPAALQLRVRIWTAEVLRTRREHSSIEVSEAADALMAEATNAP